MFWGFLFCFLPKVININLQHMAANSQNSGRPSGHQKARTPTRWVDLWAGSDCAVAAKVPWTLRAECAGRLYGVFRPLGNWECKDVLFIVETVGVEKKYFWSFSGGPCCRSTEWWRFTSKVACVQTSPQSREGPQTRGRGETDFLPSGVVAVGTAVQPGQAFSSTSSVGGA